MCWACCVCDVFELLGPVELLDRAIGFVGLSGLLGCCVCRVCWAVMFVGSVDLH